MHRSAYEKFNGDELTLRDWLAVDRTVLANERTLLAYLRTSLALVIVGGSLLKFFDSVTAEWFGFLFLAAGFLTLVIGFVRYSRERRRLGVIGRQVAMSAQAHAVGASHLNEADA